MKKYTQYINERDSNIIPITKLDHYVKWYCLWCDEHGIEPSYDLSKEADIDKVMSLGQEYAEDHQLDTTAYYLYHQDY